MADTHGGLVRARAIHEPRSLRAERQVGEFRGRDIALGRYDAHASLPTVLIINVVLAFRQSLNPQEIERV